MFATIRRYKGSAGSTDEVVRRVEQGLVPIITSQPGFVSYTAIDDGQGGAISVSVYQDRAAAEAANATAAEWVKHNIAELVAPADVIVGEVRVAATAARV